MSVLVEVRQTATGRRSFGRAPVARMGQPRPADRPAGVRPPSLREQGFRAGRAVPPPDVAVAWRLTDRGLALALAVALVLVVAALVCMGITALRVTAEPGSVAAPGILAE